MKNISKYLNKKVNELTNIYIHYKLYKYLLII